MNVEVARHKSAYTNPESSPERKAAALAELAEIAGGSGGKSLDAQLVLREINPDALPASTDNGQTKPKRVAGGIPEAIDKELLAYQTRNILDDESELSTYNPRDVKFWTNTANPADAKTWAEQNPGSLHPLGKGGEPIQFDSADYRFGYHQYQDRQALEGGFDAASYAEHARGYALPAPGVIFLFLALAAASHPPRRSV
jgi:hypothetical protein